MTGEAALSNVERRAAALRDRDGRRALGRRPLSEVTPGDKDVPGQTHREPAKLQLNYSRYADDLTFSGPLQLVRAAAMLRRAVQSIATEEGFVVNHDKTTLATLTGHRPDMIGWTASNQVFAVELASKSKARLNAILGLHRAWVDSGKIAAPFYVCGDEAGARRIERAAKRAGIPVGSHTRLELLDPIKHQTVEAFEQQRATQDQDRQARSPLNRERSRAPVVGRPKLRLIE